MSLLFQPISFRGVTARNRIWLSPMCQYSCMNQDGMPDDWHLVHLGGFATHGFGLILTEATAVAAEGRISPEDTGIWTDEQVAPWRRITQFVHAQGAVIGIQLAHAGRKASTYGMWSGRDESVLPDDGGWQTVSSTTVPFTGYESPRALTLDEVREIPGQFADAAVRSEAAGFDVVEIHAAHGYLLHQFLSPAINDRTDEYGGSFDNRARLLVEVADAIRTVWPEHKPVFARFSATDWVENGWDVQETAQIASLLADHGIDLVDVSSGGAFAEAEITTGPGYQVPFAREIRRTCKLPVGTVGMITEPAQAEQILVDGSADVVFLGRVAMREPAWPQRAAHVLRAEDQASLYRPQYERGAWR
ncbi:MAG: hypothetical protein QOH68_4276 [Nocardioidaceae bacterium]|jgi:2,4-dienoyl-CoA reductase-like NADH-dependent reductase (Old Yellow Enzyme family)|nr:hypothetical protein [Nocardioidaceae bacterium]